MSTLVSILLYNGMKEIFWHRLKLEQKKRWLFTNIKKVLILVISNFKEKTQFIFFSNYVNRKKC